MRNPLYQLTVADASGLEHVVRGSLTTLAMRIRETDYYPDARHPISLKPITSVVIEGPVSQPEEIRTLYLNAAAPDLLACCEDMLAPLKDIRDETFAGWAQQEHGEWARNWLAVRNAVRRAKGEV